MYTIAQGKNEMDTAQLELLNDCKMRLEHQVEGLECDNEDGGLADCTPENLCSICNIRQSLTDLNAAIRPDHKGHSFERTKSNGYEHWFYKVWRDWNHKHEDFLPQLLERDQISSATCKDIASVIQWLGTNCGMGMMQEAEKHGKILLDVQDHLGMPWSKNHKYSHDDPRIEIATAIALRFFTEDDKSYKYLRDIIIEAMDTFNSSSKLKKLLSRKNRL
jgi:hypothetical protein